MIVRCGVSGDMSYLLALLPGRVSSLAQRAVDADVERDCAEGLACFLALGAGGGVKGRCRPRSMWNCRRNRRSVVGLGIGLDGDRMRRSDEDGVCDE